MALTGLLASDPHAKMKVQTQVFREFPFSSPDYVMVDIETDDATVGFDVLRCPVAELFRKAGKADLCFSTWCSLDYPLVRKWGGALGRTTTIDREPSAATFGGRRRNQNREFPSITKASSSKGSYSARGERAPAGTNRRRIEKHRNRPPLQLLLAAMNSRTRPSHANRSPTPTIPSDFLSSTCRPPLVQIAGYSRLGSCTPHHCSAIYGREIPPDTVVQ